MNIKILTDSACDLPKEIINELNIDIAYLRVILDDKEFIDMKDITPREIYENMEQGALYTTSQCPLIDFYDIFTKYAKENTPLIYLSFSSALSGTFSSSLLALDDVKDEYPTWQCQIIDTKAASVGQGTIVYYAAKMVKEGKSFEDIVNKSYENIDRIAHLVAVGDLTYVARGGRMNKTVANIAESLNIKPLIVIDENGSLVVKEKIRGEKKIFKRVLELVKKNALDKDLLTCVVHANALDKANELSDALKEIGFTNILITEIGASIGSHIGPGTYAVTFLEK